MAKKTARRSSARGVALTPQMEKFIDGLVKAGRYRSQSEVVRDAVRGLMDREKERAAAVKDLRRKVQDGIDQLEAGQGVPLDDVMQKLSQREELARKVRSRKSA